MVDYSQGPSFAGGYGFGGSGFEQVNPYSAYDTGRSLPWPSTYAGAPTNAMGQAIPGFRPATTTTIPGTTLNSSPMGQMGGSPTMFQQLEAGAGRGYAANPANLGVANSLEQAGASLAAPYSGQWGGGANTGAMAQRTADLAMAGQSYGGSPTGTTLNSSPMTQTTPSNYLQLLANPGNVATPGAAIPGGVSPSIGASNNVLQSFLQGQGGNTAYGNLLSRIMASNNLQSLMMAPMQGNSRNWGQGAAASQGDAGGLGH